VVIVINVSVIVVTRVVHPLHFRPQPEQTTAEQATARAFPSSTACYTDDILSATDASDC
jgi:hypothetical protein